MTKDIINWSYFWGFGVTQTTTNAYADIFSLTTAFIEELTIVVSEDGTNDIEYIIDGSPDNTLWINLTAVQDVAAGGNAVHANYFAAEGMWRFLRVRIRADVGGAQGVVSVWCHGMRMGG